MKQNFMQFENRRVHISYEENNKLCWTEGILFLIEDVSENILFLDIATDCGSICRIPFLNLRKIYLIKEEKLEND